MRIAITADLHLTTMAEHPERYHALENILDVLVEQKIQILIIAGDLFDAACKNPGEFEKFVSKPKYSKIELYIIPGNHDPKLSDGTFILPNIHCFNDPAVIHLDEKISFVFIPYHRHKSFGEILATIQEIKTLANWVLIGHGDWISSFSQNNLYEKGIYMPLSNRDIEIYHPNFVFLGHIHIPIDTAIVKYPGSPCAIDSSEVGYRSILVFDTIEEKSNRLKIASDNIYFSEQLIVLPSTDEENYIDAEIRKIIQSWNISASDISKVLIKIKAVGYSKNRQILSQIIKDGFKSFRFTNQNQPDVSEVKISTSVVQEKVLEETRKRVENLDLNFSLYGIRKEDILLAAINAIYGGDL